MLFLPGAPVARGRKRLLTLPSRATAEPQLELEPVRERGEEEVVLPWRS